MLRRNASGVTVRLNVYDISPTNPYLNPLGMGAYHSGVELDGRLEITFGGSEGSSGVFSHPPREAGAGAGAGGHNALEDRF